MIVMGAGLANTGGGGVGVKVGVNVLVAVAVGEGGTYDESVHGENCVTPAYSTQLSVVLRLVAPCMVQIEPLLRKRDIADSLLPLSSASV